MKVKWIGHSGFKIDDLLIDPWLKRLESFGIDAPYELKEEDKKVKVIVITHAHEDHFLGAWEFAKEQKAIVAGTPETIGPAMQEGCEVEMLNIGGPVETKGWKINLVHAFHTGNPTGAILEKNNKIIYHAGDTGLFSDMKMIGEIFKPDVAILPIGGRFTMNEEQAAIAAKWIGAKTVIPMHYNTFPMVAADANKFKTLVEKECDSKVQILEIGEETNI